jgi:adenylate cyclase
MFKENLFKKALKLYAGEHVVKRIEQYGKNALNLGGEKKDMTIYFQGIAGFTSLSDPPPSPEELVCMLNEYLSKMTKTIRTHGGFIDMYIGDAIMAYWGIDDKPDHAIYACKCALACVKQAKHLSKKWERILSSSLKISIGINTGSAIIGNIGSEDRMRYTVMGDAVNFASRLEGANKHCNTRILISQFTKNALNSSFLIKEVDSVRVKGKTDPIKLYTLEKEDP